MVRKLQLKTSEDYGIFKLDEQIDLEGNVILLTGLNGVGKTQFLEILKGDGRMSNNQRQLVVRDLKIDGENITKDKVVYKHFSEFVGVGGFSSVQKDQAVRNSFDPYIKYQNCSFKNFAPGNEAYSNSLEFLKKHLNGKNYTADDQTIYVKDVKKIEGFEWRVNDRFALDLDQLFESHCCKVNKLRQSIADNIENPMEVENIKKNIESLTSNAPWKKLNDKLEQIKSKYKFADKYDVLDGGGLDPGMNIIDKSTNSERNLNHLSDGEKTLLSITVSSIQEAGNVKLLLLDEIDNVLNPEMLPFLKQILQETAERGILVILVTHSSDTVSCLMDKHSNIFQLFEMYQKETVETRFLQLLNPVATENNIYVSSAFYSESDITLINDLREKMSGKKVLIVEGKTDGQILEETAKRKGVKLDFEILAAGSVTKFHRIIAFVQKYMMINTDCKVMFLFDNDVAGNVAYERCAKQISDDDKNIKLYKILLTKEESIFHCYLSEESANYNFLEIDHLLFNSDTEIHFKKVKVLNSDLYKPGNKDAIVAKIKDLSKENLNHAYKLLDEITNFFIDAPEGAK